MSQPPMSSPPPGAVHSNTGTLPTQVPGQGGNGKLVAIVGAVLVLVVGIGAGLWILTDDGDGEVAASIEETTESEPDRGANVEEDEDDEAEEFIEVPEAGIYFPTRTGWSTSIGAAVDNGYESWYEAPSPVNVESTFGVIVTSIEEPQTGVPLEDQALESTTAFANEFFPEADVEVEFQHDSSLDDHDIHWSNYDFFESSDAEAREIYAKAIHIDMGDEIVGVMGITPWASGDIWFHLHQIIEDVGIMETD